MSIISNITQYCGGGIINDDEFDCVFEGREHGTNCTEYVMKYCRPEKYNFILLLNDPFVSPESILEIFFPLTDNRPYSHRIEDFNNEELESLMMNYYTGNLYDFLCLIKNCKLISK